MLTPLGDDQKPWVLASAILVLAGARGRRAAAAAWRALAVGAALARLLDVAVQRERPGLGTRKGQPPLGDQVSSPSMPSTRAASAMAFTVAAWAEEPRSGLLCVPLAVLTGVSRVASGRHYPSDVAAGAVIGVVGAGLARLTWSRVRARLYAWAAVGDVW